MKHQMKHQFRTGPNPFGKDYLVATEDGSMIICTLQSPNYESDQEMREVAKVIEKAVSEALDKKA